MIASVNIINIVNTLHDFLSYCGDSLGIQQNTTNCDSCVAY